MAEAALRAQVLWALLERRVGEDREREKFPACDWGFPCSCTRVGVEGSAHVGRPPPTSVPSGGRRVLS